MRRLLCAAATAVLIVACVSCCSANRRPLRFSVCQLQPVVSDLREYENGTRGMTLEYSLGDTFRGEKTASDASISLSYLRVSYTQLDTRDATRTVRHDVESDVVTLGANWRFGAGADPSRDGYYAGVGMGVAFGAPTVDMGAQGFGGFESGRNGHAWEWRLMAGMNFAAVTFGELSYRKIGPDAVYALNVGVRL